MLGEWLMCEGTNADVDIIRRWSRVSAAAAARLPVTWSDLILPVRRLILALSSLETLSVFCRYGMCEWNLWEEMQYLCPPLPPGRSVTVKVSLTRRQCSNVPGRPENIR